MKKTALIGINRQFYFRISHLLVTLREICRILEIFRLFNSILSCYGLLGALDVGTTSFLRRSVARFTPFASGSVAQRDVKVLGTSGSVDCI